MRKILLLTLFVGLQVQAQQVEQLLTAFEQKPCPETANAFFGELLHAEFLDEKITFNNQATVDSLRQQVCYWAAEWYYDQQQYEQAERHAAVALPLYHVGNDERADCLNLLAMIAVRQGHIAQAASYAKQCLEMDRCSGDDDRIASSMNTVAGIYMAGYQAKEAEQYILGALNHIGRVDNPPRHAVILGMASEVYHTLGNDQLALAYAQEAYHIDSILGRRQQMAIRLSQQGSALLGLHRYADAEHIYRQVIPTLKAAGDSHSYAIALNRLGMALLCQDRQREAIPYYKEAATLFAQMGDLYNELHSHRGLYESYWTVDSDSAKMELDRFELLKDSLYKHSTADALSRYNAEFGYDLLQQENASMRQARRHTIFIALSAMLIILVIALLAFRRLRRRQQLRIQELMEEINHLTAHPTPTKVEGSHEQDDTTADDATACHPTSTSPFLQRLVEVVNEGLVTGDYSVEAIASKMNMSISTFRRRLLSDTGETPKAFILSIQMQRAAMLLAESPETSIQQVARLCGFDEISSFGHTFKRIYGCSPSQYREARKAQNQA